MTYSLGTNLISHVLLLMTALSFLLGPKYSYAESPKKNFSSIATEKVFVPEKQEPRGVFTSGCPGTVELIFDDMILTPPRNWGGMHYYTKDGKVVNKLSPNHPSKDCSFKSVKDVRSFTTGTFAGGHRGFSVIEIDNKSGKTLDNESMRPSYAEKILSLADKAEELPNGIKKVTWEGYEYYLLPIDKAPTLNHEPIILQCEGLGKAPRILNFCRTKYVLPDGYGFSYSFYRKFHYESDYLTVDQNKRKEYEEIKHSKP